jgi:cytochrome b561
VLPGYFQNCVAEIAVWRVVGQTESSKQDFAMVKGYSPTQIALHWVVGILIVLQLVFGDSMTDVYRAFRRSGAADLTLMAWLHIIAGVAVLVFAGWRLVLRVTRGAPPAPEGESAAFALAGAVSHWVLYALMVLVPITGLLAWYADLATMGELHQLAKPALIILIGLHVAAALYHQFILKDGLLNRMRKAQD